MIKRLTGRKNTFKVGQNERLIYEKVAGMKSINVLLSILYNFSSEGAFSDIQTPVNLIGA